MQLVDWAKEYVSLSHWVHSLDGTSEVLYVFSGHMLHSDFPVDAWYFPATQFIHVFEDVAS